MKPNVFLFLLIISLCIIAAKPCNAEIITFQTAGVISGAVPGDPSPWLTASFNDHPSSGSVTLTLSANLTGTEFISEVYFNLDPSLNPNSLTFDMTNAQKTGAFNDPAIATGANAYKADGDGYCDVKFSFATKAGSNARFDGTDSYTIDISGIPSLNAQSFNYPSMGSTSGYKFFAHVQGIATSDPNITTSCWVVVPEPSVLILLSMGISALALYGWRRR